jgi:hypothetical protein
MKSMILVLALFVSANSHAASDLENHMQCSHTAYQAVDSLVKMGLSKADQRALEIRKVNINSIVKNEYNQAIEDYSITFGYKTGEIRDGFETHVVVRGGLTESDRCTVQAYEVKF